MTQPDDANASRLRLRIGERLKATYQAYVSIAVGIAIFLAPVIFPIKCEWGWATNGAQAGFVLSVLAAAFLLVVVPKRIKSDQEEADARFTAEIDSLYKQREAEALGLVDGLTIPVTFYAENASKGTKLNEKREAMSRSRVNIMAEMRHGLCQGSHVRVNLFTINDDAATLSVQPGNVAGGPRSRNTYGPGHDTYETAIEGKGRVEPDCTDPAEFPDIMNHLGEPRYRSFAAFPIVVPGRLFGIAAVDADRTKAFTKLDDKLLTYYSNLLAITFLYENHDVWLPTRGEPESEISG